MKNSIFFSILFVLLFFNKIIAQDPPQLKEGFKMTNDFKDPYIEQDKNYRPKTAKAITNHSFDALHYRLELDFYSNYSSPYQHTYYGTETFTFKVDSALNSIRLNAIDSFITVDSVVLAGVSFLQNNDTLKITLDTIYNTGDTVDVRIYYRHNNVMDNAFYTGNGFVYTDCSPEKARNWFPCWDKTFDKATFEVIVNSKKNTELCSNGTLIDSVTTNDTLKYHWKSHDPVATYIMAILSNLNFNFLEIYWKKPSNPLDSIPVMFYNNNGEDISPLKNVMIDMMDYFSSVYGEYSFEKIAWATLDNQFPWAGMENQTLISLYTNGWADKTTTSHEFAHHWFGDLITPATWADVFLKEGFAQYSVFLWYEHLQGTVGYQIVLNKCLNDYFSYNPNPAWPIYDTAWATTTPPSATLFNYAITYCKSPFVFHMLRFIVGDSIFFNILKDYATDPNLMFKTASFADFYNKVNSNYGEDLSWFLDEWLKQPNHPNYSNNFNVQDSSGIWKVQFTTQQIQTNAPFFKMPIQLEIDFDDYTDTIVMVMNDQNNQTFTFYFPKEPISIIFDPFSNILPKIETTPIYCTGTTTLTAPSDTISDGSGITNYDNNSNCKWEITPTGAASVTLHFNSFDLEPGNDKVRVIDIANTAILGTFSGTTLPPDVTSPSGQMRIIFTTNSTVTESGFEASYISSQVGFEEYSTMKDLEIYPNPASDKLHVSFDIIDCNDATIQLIDLKGQQVYFESIPNGVEFNKNIDIINFARGIYNLRIITSGEIINKKIAFE